MCVCVCVCVQLGYLLSLAPAEAEKVKDKLEALGLQFVVSHNLPPDITCMYKPVSLVSAVLQ